MGSLFTRTCCALALAFAFSAGVAHAATITVNTTADDFDSTNDGVCNSPSGCTLRAAIRTAGDTARPGHDDIVFSVPGPYHVTMGVLSPDDVTITGSGARNSIIDGGAANGIFAVAGGKSLTLVGLTLTNGAGGQGGAIASTGTLTLQDVAITNNHSANTAGAIESSGTTTITGSTISGNTASTVGGGIYVNSGTLTVTNSTFSDNHAGPTWDAGAIYLNTGATLHAQNVTIANNFASNGAGISFATGATAQIRNSIVAGNNPDPGQNANCAFSGSPFAISLGHNLASDSTCGFVGPGDKAPADPLLGALGNNGGGTDTMAIPQNSPAFDAGDAAGCPATDQRGITRPQFGGCDIGAFEVQAPPPPPPPGRDTTAPKVKLGGPHSESIKHPLYVLVTADEAGTVKVTGSISVPKLAKVYKLKGSSKAVAAGTRAKLKLTIPKKALKQIKHALAAHKKLKAKIVITAKDAAGNTKVARRTIKLKK